MFSAISGFDKSKLKPTQTKVLTVDGRILCETLNERGQRVTKQLASGEQGFIGDVKQDLQVGEVLPGLIIGSQDVAHDEDLVKKYKVTHILNAASMVENIFQHMITYKNIPIYDIPEANIRAKFDEAHRFLEDGMSLGCVLVHCNAGVSRAATLVISYLMKYQKMSYVQAYDYLKDKRPAIRPNDGFVKQLKDFESELEYK